jgi:hypothetical protein
LVKDRRLGAARRHLCGIGKVESVHQVNEMPFSSTAPQEYRWPISFVINRPHEDGA